MSPEDLLQQGVPGNPLPQWQIRLDCCGTVKVKYMSFDRDGTNIQGYIILDLLGPLLPFRLISVIPQHLCCLLSRSTTRLPGLGAYLKICFLDDFLVLVDE